MMVNPLVSKTLFFLWGGNLATWGGELWHVVALGPPFTPRPLAEKCGALLAEWVDATAEEMHDRIDSMSEVPAAGQRIRMEAG